MDENKMGTDTEGNKTKLGVMLLRDGKINTVQFETALLYQKLLRNRGKRMKIGQFLVKHGCINSETLCKTLIEQTHHKPKNLSLHDPAVLPH